MIYSIFLYDYSFTQTSQKIMISNFFTYFFSFESWWSMDVGSWCISTNYDADWNEKDWREIEFPEKCSYLFKDVQWYLVEVVWCPWSGEYYFFIKTFFFDYAKIHLNFLLYFLLQLEDGKSREKNNCLFCLKKRLICLHLTCFCDFFCFCLGIL